MARKKTPPKKKSRVEGEIRKLQRSTDLLIRKAPFCRLVRGKWLILSFKGWGLQLKSLLQNSLFLEQDLVN